MKRDLLNYYLNVLNYKKNYYKLAKYYNSPSLKRLMDVSYFCGMDYASKNIYNFKEYITRFDHSISVALLTNYYTNDLKQILAGLFHDIATPCFSHVIDYMNKDYATQESTEAYTYKILESDKYLIDLLKEDRLTVDDLDFKKYSIVDTPRPKLCADRLDGIILTSISWTKNINQKDIKDIISNSKIYINEDNEKEIGFKNESIALKVVQLSEVFDVYSHSNEDNYMMELLANITKKAIDYEYINYDDLYVLNEKELFRILNNSNDEIKKLLNTFYNIKKEEIKELELPYIKKREIKPIINSKRLK